MLLALRRLAQSRTFTLVAVLTLALGLGGTTTVLTWLDRVLLDPLPGAAEVDRLVALESVAGSGELIDSSYPDYRDYAARATTLDSVLAFKDRPLVLGHGDRPERVWAEFVTGNFFSTLGVTPQLGRFFTSSDAPDAPAAATVVVISDQLWRRQFGADVHVVGRPLVLNQHTFTVIGVAPAGFFGAINGLAFDVYLPLPFWSTLTRSPDWLESRGSRPLHVLARLAPGSTRAEAQAELTGLATQLATTHPTTNREVGIAVLPITDSPHGVHRLLARPLLVLLGVSGLVLIVVCANLANLLFVRASARQREMCIRQALGAGTWRLVRQLLAEALLLSLAGTALGLLLALWLTDALRLFLPVHDLPLELTAGLDLRTLAFTAGLAGLTTLGAGLAPALWVARPNLMLALRHGSRGSDGTRQPERLRSALVVVQVAVALVTLTCAGLAAKSVRAMQRADPGFDPAGVLLVGVKLDAHGYTAATGVAFFERLRARLATLPGVDGVALAEDVPLDVSAGSWEDVSVPGYTPAPGENMKLYRNLVSPDYFAVMRTRLLHGREFTAQDVAPAAPVAIVSATFARRYFGTTDVLGRTFQLWGGRRTLTIVGVARDVAQRSLGEAPQPFFYLPLARMFQPATGVAVHLRTSGEPLALLPAVRTAIRELDPAVPVFDALSLADFIDVARVTQRAAGMLLGVLASLTVILSALGLYGVLSFAVARRTAEIGVRLALGATPAHIATQVLRRGLTLIGPGVVLGLGGALAASTLLAGFFYGVHRFEPLLFAAAAVVVTLAALLACYLPSRRASRLDPLAALRAE